MIPPITRRLEIDAGHRLQKHESKCRHVHGHRYVFEVTCAADELDEVGRVIDFSVVKEKVGGWLDEALDHGFIVERSDPIAEMLAPITKLYVMPSPPTAENLAVLVLAQARELLEGNGLRVVRVVCYETPNCWAEAT